MARRRTAGPRTASDHRVRFVPEPVDTPAPPSTAVAVGRFHRTSPRHGATRSRGAPGWVILHTVAGAGSVSQGEVRVTACRDRLIILAAGGHHAYYVSAREQNWDVWWAHFPVQSSWVEWLEPHRRGSHLYAVEADPPVLDRIDGIWQRIYADLAGPAAAPGSPADLMHVDATTWTQRQLGLNGIEEVILSLLDTGSRLDFRDADPRIAQAVSAIASEPTTADLDRLAAAAHLSVSRFAHLFTEITGTSPNKMIINARMDAARRLLETTDLRIAEIARACGSPNPFYFSKVFRRRFGTSPSAYRAMLHTELG